MGFFKNHKVSSITTTDNHTTDNENETTTLNSADPLALEIKLFPKEKIEKNEKEKEWI